MTTTSTRLLKGWLLRLHNVSSLKNVTFLFGYNVTISCGVNIRWQIAVCILINLINYAFKTFSRDSIFRPKYVFLEVYGQSIQRNKCKLFIVILYSYDVKLRSMYDGESLRGHHCWPLLCENIFHCSNKIQWGFENNLDNTDPNLIPYKSMENVKNSQWTKL